MIRNIVLDVGRVLIQWEPEAAMKKLGISEEVISILSEKLFASGAWNEEDRGALSEEEILDFLVSQAPAYEKEIHLFWEHVDTAICQFPYTRSWIRDFRQQGYQVYILSNYGKSTYEKTKAEALNFLEDVNGALFSYEEKTIKPEMEIYQKFLKRFDLNPAECVFLDDMPVNIEGAKKAGFHGIVFRNIEQAKKDLEQYEVYCTKGLY